MSAFYQALSEQGIETRILCHFKYWQTLIENKIPERRIFLYKPNQENLLLEIFKKEWIKSLETLASFGKLPCLIMNPHPGIPLFLDDYSKIIGGKRIIWLHEPDKKISELLPFGLFQGIYFFIVLMFNRWSVRNADHCFLPSDFALKRFKAAYPTKSDFCSILPLAFPKIETSPRDRIYCSYIGHINRGKGIDLFLGIVDYCHKQDLDFKFQIVSSTFSEPWLSQAKKYEKINLKIVSKNYITDLEIAEANRSSFVVICPYRSVTQSGVVANAFMQGTPVIGSNIGSLPEVITQGKTGYIVSDLCNYSLIVKYLKSCIDKIHEFEPYCINDFNKNYSVDTIKIVLPNLISKILI